MKRLLALAFALLPCLFAAGAARAEPVKLRYAWVSATSDAPLLMFAKPGIAQHEGVAYTLEPIRFQGSPPMITALAAGEIDLGGFGFSSLPIAVENAGMSDLRIIADLFQDGVPGHYSNEFLVLKDGPVRTIDDMKGRIAAANSAGSAIDIALRAMLLKHGLVDKRDVTIVEAAFPNMPAMLSEKKVDLIAGARPFSADPAVRAYARTLFTQAEAMGRSQMAVLAGRASFLEKNRAAVVAYLEDELRAIRWYEDPAHHDEAVKVIADFMKQPPAIFTNWLFTKSDDEYRDPNGIPDLGALQANVDLVRQLGFVKSAPEVAAIADFSYVKEAASRLK